MLLIWRKNPIIFRNVGGEKKKRKTLIVNFFSHEQFQVIGRLVYHRIYSKWPILCENFHTLYDCQLAICKTYSFRIGKSVHFRLVRV